MKEASLFSAWHRIRLCSKRIGIWARLSQRCKICLTNKLLTTENKLKMARGSGNTRVSKWFSRDNLQEQLYYKDEARVEYAELSELGKRLVKDEKNKVVKELYAKLKNEKTTQVIDNGQVIQIGYTSKGCDHFANDAMLTLSGKYFS